MHASRNFLLMCLGVLLSGCFGSSNTARVTSDYAALVKTVGIVSLVSPTANISYLASSDGKSYFSTTRVKGLDSDELVFNALSPRLKRKGFTVRPLPRTPALAKLRDSDWRSPTGNSVAEAIYALGESSGMDMIVVVQAQVDGDFVTDTSQKMRSYGLQRASGTEAFVYATMFVEAYDIKNRFAVGRAAGRLSELAYAGAWDPAFERSGEDDVILSNAGVSGFSEQVVRVLTAAIGIASQEAGL